MGRAAAGSPSSRWWAPSPAGKSRQDPLGWRARSPGRRRSSARSTEAGDDPRWRPSSLRVDSRGGDGLASDLMYRAVLEAKKNKPVVASMGDVAASGGYYAAMGAEEICASPATITGSIGVFFIKPALEELRREAWRQPGPHARRARGLRQHSAPWTREAARGSPRSGWTRSTTPSSPRPRSQPQDDQGAASTRSRAAACGPATDAKARGLVDQLGGLARRDRRRARAGPASRTEEAVDSGRLRRAPLRLAACWEARRACCAAGRSGARAVPAPPPLPELLDLGVAPGGPPGAEGARPWSRFTSWISRTGRVAMAATAGAPC